MDDRRFDDISRLLGDVATRREGLKVALAAVLGGAAAVAAVEERAEAGRKRRKKCDPPCAAGQTCDRSTRTCRCDNGGTVCGANCCAIGQACQGGQCVIMPEPGQCTAFGAMCKDTGIPCCDGLTCASGQGGKGDIACYKPAGVACERTAECVYDSTCKGGVCVANPQPQPVPPGPRCDKPPTFVPTADASANGKALQDAIAAAADGDSIVLAPGTYQFDEPSGVLNGLGGPSFVGVADLSLNIERCGADAAITLVCPSTVTANNPWTCVLAKGSGASVTLRGLTIEGSVVGYFGFGVFAESGAMLALEDVAVQVSAAIAGQPRGGISAEGASTTVTIKSGVSVDSLVSGSGFGLSTGNAATIACDAGVDFEGNFTGRRCFQVTDPDCGCTS